MNRVLKRLALAVVTLATWYWNTWNSTTAKSTGTLWVDNCVPNCAQGKESYHHLYVTMSGVKYHNGHAFYSVMTW